MHHDQEPESAMQRGSNLLREKTEIFFRWLSLRVVSHPWWAIAVMVAITAAILPAYRNLTMDFSTEAFLPTHDQVKIDYNNFREQFGQASFGLVTIETPSDVFTLENLQRIKALQDDIEAHVPHIDEINSLVSVKHTIGSESGLEVRDLEAFWPKTEADMPAFKKMVLGNPNYVGNMVSANGRITSLVVKLDNYSGGHTTEDIDELVSGFDEAASPVDAEASTQNRFLSADEEGAFTKGLIAVAEKHEAEGFRIWLNGLPVINYQMSLDMGESMMRDTSIGILVLAVLLLCLFHRVSGVLLPLMVVFLSLITTIALMPLFGVPLMGSAQILPVFLLAVGIADSMHILAVFYRHYDEGGNKQESVLYAMTTTAIAVLMTSVTTAAGLASFVLADLKPIQYLGVFGAGGTMLALVYTIVLLPALLMVLPIQRRPVMAEESGRFTQKILHAVDRMVHGLSSFAMHHAKAVFAVTLLLVLWSAIGISKIYFSHDPVRWYPVDHPTRIGSELIDRELSGTMTLEVIFDSGKENGLYDPRFMQMLEKTEKTLLNNAPDDVQIKQTVSILGVVKENHKILNEGQEEYYRIPDTREEIAQELLLFENSGSDDLEEFTDSQFRIARVSAILPFQNMVGVQDYIERLNKTLHLLITESGVEGVSVHITGLVMIFAKTLWAMLWGTISNYFQSFIMVGALMFLMMGNARAGMLSFGPNLLPVLFTIGMMGWFGIPMDILTSMVGCIIIGIAVDDTIHFMHHYRNFSSKGCDPETAVRKTLDIAGRAIVFTSVVLVGCFMVHTLDTFVNAQNFGTLLSFALTAALLSNLVIVPALLKLFWKRASN